MREPCLTLWPTYKRQEGGESPEQNYLIHRTIAVKSCGWMKISKLYLPRRLTTFIASPHWAHMEPRLPELVNEPARFPLGVRLNLGRPQIIKYLLQAVFQLFPGKPVRNLEVLRADRINRFHFFIFVTGISRRRGGVKPANVLSDGVHIDEETASASHHNTPPQ